MPIEEKRTCNMHTKEKEKSGTCCQLDEKNDAEQATYEYSVDVKSVKKENHE